MKALKYTAAILIPILLILYVILFTAPGNSLLASAAQTLIKQKSGINLSINTLELSPSSLNLEASINGGINTKISGYLSLFSQKMDLQYNIVATNLKEFNLDLKNNINLHGKISGKFKDFNATAAGEIFSSKPEFDVRVLNYQPFTLKLDASGINIDDILSLISKPAYTNAKLDIKADIKANEGIQTGSASIKLKSSALNGALIKKDFGINLPQAFSLNSITQLEIEGDLVRAKHFSTTPIGSIKTTNTLYNISQQLLNTDLLAAIPDLGKLEPIIGQKLQGDIALRSNFSAQKGELSQLSASLSGLGKEVVASLNNGLLNLKADEIEIEKLLAILAKPKLASGKINIIASMQDLGKASLNGKIFLKSKGEILKSAELAKAGLRKSVPFELDISAPIKDNVADAQGSIKSGLIDIAPINARYDLRSKSLKANLLLKSANAQGLKEFLGLDVKNELSGEASLMLNNQALVNASLKTLGLGGSLNANYDGKKLGFKLDFENVDEILALAGFKGLGKGRLNAELNLSGDDINNISGSAKISLKDGTIFAKPLSEILQKPAQKDIDINLNLLTKIDNGELKTNASLVSNIAKISDANATFDIKSKTLQSNLKLQLPDLGELKFITSKKLKGTLEADLSANMKDEKIDALLTSKIFKGDLKATLKNEQLNAKLENFELAGLFDMLDMYEFYQGKGNGVLNYSLASQSGDFNLDVSGGQLKSNGLTTLISAYLQKDITQDVFKTALLKGTIKNDMINFNADLKADASNISVQNGTLNLKTDAINIPINAKVKDKDLSIKVSGTTKEPKYGLSSKYLQDKAKKEIGKLLQGLIK